MPVFLAMASAYSGLLQQHRCEGPNGGWVSSDPLPRYHHGGGRRRGSNMNEGAVPWLDLPGLCSRALLCGEISSQKHVF